MSSAIEYEQRRTRMMFGFAPIVRTSPQVIRRAESNAPRKLQVLRDALLAICEGKWDQAENTLTIDGATTPHDAALLNLLGVICQGRREWKQARRFFGKAMRANRRYTPAEQNMRRLYELSTFGRTELPVALLDHA